MKKIITAIFITIVCISFNGCPEPVESTDVDQTKIYQVYSAEYDAEYLDVISTAEFRMNSQSGSFVELSGSSYVKVNDNNMIKQDFLNYIYYLYHLTNSANLNTYKWEYKNGNNTVFINETNLNTVVITLQNIEDTIHKSQNYSFGWNEPIAGLETVTMEFRYQDSVLSSLTSSQTGQSAFVLPSSTLQQYPEGIIKVNVKKSDQFNTQQNNSVGGIIKRIYRSVPRTFVLVP